MTLQQRLERVLGAAQGWKSSAVLEEDIEALRMAVGILENEAPSGSWSTEALGQLRHVAPELFAPQLMLAENQPEYATVCAALVKHPDFPTAGLVDNGTGALLPFNTHLLAVRPGIQHLAALAAGANIYISLLTFGHAMPPIIVQVGKASAAATYNVKPS